MKTNIKKIKQFRKYDGINDGVNDGVFIPSWLEQNWILGNCK